MRRPDIFLTTAAILAAASSGSDAGVFSAALNDPSNAHDAPIPGFVGPDGIGKARLDTFMTDGSGNPIYQNPDNYPNPLILAWADQVAGYQRSDGDYSYSDPSYALGPVTGDNFDVVSLGDLSASEISNGVQPGSITVSLAAPVKDLSGADFVVFENGHIAATNQGGAGAGGIFAELAYVEVSADGENFVRFPSVSLTPAPSVIGGLYHQYGSINATDVHNLAGKHVNAYGDCWGTPFDLAELGIGQITHIRIVDVPGNGFFKDRNGGPIYDPWRTFGSGGFDLEAVGVISMDMHFSGWPQLALLDEALRGPDDDPDHDGFSNLLEYAFGLVPWRADPAGSAPMLTLDGPAPLLVFMRDERAADLTYEVQFSVSPGAGPWTTVARSTAGAPLASEGGADLEISETSASGIQSVGVIRRVSVKHASAPAGRGFYRVKITTTEPSSSSP